MGMGDALAEPIDHYHLALVRAGDAGHGRAARAPPYCPAPDAEAGEDRAKLRFGNPIRRHPPDG
jgi:hypothetical protein